MIKIENLTEKQVAMLDEMWERDSYEDYCEYLDTLGSIFFGPLLVKNFVFTCFLRHNLYITNLINYMILIILFFLFLLFLMDFLFLFQ